MGDSSVGGATMTTAEFLLARKLGNGGGGEVTIESLNVTENGTYSEQGKAYSPVIVNVAMPPNSFVRKSLTGGAIASFSDGSDNPLANLKIGIDPIQDLHGYDKPWAGGAGKNLADKPSDITVSGVTVTVADDGTITINGTASSYGIIRGTFTCSDSTATYTWGLFNPTATNDIEFSVRKANGDSAGGWARANAVNKSFTFVPEAAPTMWQIQVGNGATFNNWVCKPMIVSGSTAPTTYEPYANICPISGWSSVEVTVADDTTDPTTEETYEIALGQTVYGGKLNVTTGELTVDRAMVDLGTVNWVYASSAQVFGSNQFTPFVLTNGRLVCTQYEWNSTPNVGPSNMSDGQISASPYFNRQTVMVKDSRYTDAATFKTAVSGVMLCYELETPTTTTLTPTQVSSLLGSNNIWADSGDIIEGQYFSALS